MADFEQAISIILKHEGGYVNDSADPGGATKYGISLRYLKNLSNNQGDLNADGIVDVNDVKNMSLQQAIAIYRKDWWYRYNYYLINDQTLATKIFDMAVNMGGGQAHKLLQRACNRVIGQDALKVDGLLGPKTLSQLNLLQAGQLLTVLREEMANFYHNLVKQKPSLAKFLRGWLNRAAA